MPFPITIIGFGIGKGMFSDEIDRYMRLIQPYASLSVVHLKASAGSAHSDATTLRNDEGKRLCEKWTKRSYPVALSEEGELYTSHSFSRWLADRVNTGRIVTFNIGSAHGLSPAIKKQCRDVISLSPLTLPHRLSYIVLIEQLYRACTILKGHPYHK
jgi:23S rRNA (pseudouridine1915-N3)-methyltransferase